MAEDFGCVSNGDLGRKLLICADGGVCPSDDILREAGERLVDATLYANGRATADAVLKIALARHALESIADWLEVPTGPDESKVARGLAREALAELNSPSGADGRGHNEGDEKR